MAGVLRVVLVALLALTVPVQGLASVTMERCMPTGQQHDGGHGHDGDPDSDHEHTSSAPCGPCAACCAAAVAAATVVPVTFEPAAAASPFASAGPAVNRPDTPDRPPLAG